MQAQAIKRRLETHGWAILESIQDVEGTLIEAGRMLGQPAQLRDRGPIEVLTPKGQKDAPRASLSSRYGFSAFPLHCDAAHLPVPYRYILLGCLNAGQSVSSTCVLSRDRIKLSDSEIALARSSVFYIRNGRRSFYASILSAGLPFIRIDPGCMEPTNADARIALDLFSSKRNACALERIDWSPGEIVVLDNWRVLHGRDRVETQDSSRILLRVYAHEAA